MVKNPKRNHRRHRNPSYDSILRQSNSVHTFRIFLFIISCNIWAVLLVLRKTAFLRTHNLHLRYCSLINANCVVSFTRDSDVTFENNWNMFLNIIQYPLFLELTDKSYIFLAVTLLLYTILRQTYLLFFFRNKNTNIVNLFKVRNFVQELTQIKIITEIILFWGWRGMSVANIIRILYSVVMVSFSEEKHKRVARYSRCYGNSS